MPTVTTCVTLLTSLRLCWRGMDWMPAVVWGKRTTRGTYIGGEAAVGGCSWWGRTGQALHPREQRP